MKSKRTRRLEQMGILALGLLLGCGGTSRRESEEGQPPSPLGGTGGTLSNASGAAGDNATSGGNAPVAGAGNGPSAGGSIGGGTSEAGGAAGEGPELPELDLPPGCVPRAPKEAAELCSLAVDCEASASVGTYCHQLDSGLWECQCANHDSMYRLENVAGLHACALVAKLCSDTNLELGEESCEPTRDTADASSCAVDYECERPIDLDAKSDARAWRLRSGSARCNQWQPGESFTCSCVNGTESTTHELLAESGELACGPLADFCVRGEDPIFEPEVICVPQNATSEGGECYRKERCGAQMPLDEDVRLVDVEEVNLNCGPASGSGSECSCSTTDKGFSFRLASAPTDATCESSIPICAPNAVFEATSPPSCKPPSLADHGDACAADLTCDQSATVGGRSLVAHGRLSLICGRAGVGQPWSCGCASARDTAQIQLGASGSTALQACAQAADACLEEVGFPLGLSGETLSPPFPVF